MVAIQADRPLCATCRLTIGWGPVWRDGRAYCCGGCAAGGPCTCSYDLPSADAASMGVGGGGRRPVLPSPGWRRPLRRPRPRW